MITPASTTVGLVGDTGADMNARLQVVPRTTHLLHRTPWKPPLARSAKGINIELEDGRTVIDGVGGAAVACIGSGHPVVVQAIKDQVDRLSYVYSMQVSNGPAEELADYLVKTSDGVFDCCGIVSGGSEAMEAVIKLARQYFYETNQPRRTKFIGRHLAYHGNTIGTLGLANNPGRRKPYEPCLNHETFHHISPAYAKRFQRADESEEDYVERLRKELDNKFQELGPDNVIGFVAETVAGATSGVVPAPKGYFKAMKSVCKKYGALFILDEVMCGMGRMGTLHGWQSFGDGVTPDIQGIAKGLGGGYVSIGAVLMTKRIADGIRNNSGMWQHGHTYQAHPVTCAGALAVQETISSENLLENCRVKGVKLKALLQDRLQGSDVIAAPFTFDIRGGGGFWGIEFDFDGPQASSLDFKGKTFALLVQARCLEHGLILMGLTGGANIEGTKGDHFVLAPPFNVTDQEIEDIVDRFVRSVEEILKESGL